MTPELWAQAAAISVGILTTIAVRFVIPLLRKQKPPREQRRSQARRPRRDREGEG